MTDFAVLTWPHEPRIDQATHRRQDPRRWPDGNRREGRESVLCRSQWKLVRAREAAAWRVTLDDLHRDIDDMDLDEDKIDEAVLALLRLTLHDGRRAWKGFDWDSMDRLHRKGWITDPVGKARSVSFTDEGLQRSKRLLEQLFGKKSDPAP